MSESDALLSATTFNSSSVSSTEAGKEKVTVAYTSAAVGGARIAHAQVNKPSLSNLAILYAM